MTDITIEMKGMGNSENEKLTPVTRTGVQETITLTPQHVRLGDEKKHISYSCGHSKTESQSSFTSQVVTLAIAGQPCPGTGLERHTQIALEGEERQSPFASGKCKDARFCV